MESKAKRWYVVHTYSGYENRVRDELEHRIQNSGIEDQVVDIKIPTETVTELKEGGKRETKEAKVFPGYVLVRMEMNKNAMAVVRNTPGVTGFAGISGKPTPLTRDEYKKIMRRTEPSQTKEVRHAAVDFEVGEPVRVVSGPLESFDGVISEINAEAGKVKVMLTIFGRETPVELGAEQITSLV